MPNFDFSQFHPLDHWPGPRRCRGHYGGWRRHLRLAWEFRRRDQLLRPIRRLLACPFGWHRVDTWFARTPTERRVLPVCRYCRYRRLPSEHDVDEMQRHFRDWGLD